VISPSLSWNAGLSANSVAWATNIVTPLITGPAIARSARFSADIHAR
jgi:hypothetical protein